MAQGSAKLDGAVLPMPAYANTEALHSSQRRAGGSAAAGTATSVLPAGLPPPPAEQVRGRGSLSLLPRDGCRQPVTHGCPVQVAARQEQAKAAGSNVWCDFKIAPNWHFVSTAPHWVQVEGLLGRTLATALMWSQCVKKQAASKVLRQPSPTAALEVGASSSFPASPFLPGAAQAACASDAAAQPGLAAAPLLSDASSHSSSGSRLMPIHEVRMPPQHCITRSPHVRSCIAH